MRRQDRRGGKRGRPIVEALDTLTASATEEAHSEIAAFARKLIHHAITEEQVMYPAALLVGEYVRAKSVAS